MAKKPKIGIIGLGMVGSPLKRFFEEKGYKRGRDLFCYDTDPKKGFLDDIRDADIVFVAVPTPRKSDGSCDTSIIESVIKKFSAAASKNKIFVIKSTIEPGTAAKLRRKYGCFVLFSPEFLTEANAWMDFIKPDRQIVGHTEGSERHTKKVLNILPAASFCSPGKNICISATEAEMGKYGANVFGAMKVVFGNILADFCAALEIVLRKENGSKEKINYNNVRHILANDKRIGDCWLDINHGNYRGFGGFCYPKDTDAFIAFAKKIRKTLSSKNKNEQHLKRLINRGIDFLESMREYNIELLKMQGLTLNDVSCHNSELEEKLKLKNAKRQNN